MIMRFITWMGFLIIFSYFQLISTYAAIDIPRTDLRLELMLATGTLDTSGMNRIIETSGSTITFWNDSKYGNPSARFLGSS